MKVKSFVLVCVLAGLVTGCDSRKDAAVDAASKPVQPPVADSVASKPACLHGKGYDQLPPDVCLPQQFEFHSIRRYQDKEGRNRKRVTFAYENGVDDVVKSLSSAMTSIGYRARARENKADGSILVPFTRGDAGTTYLEIKSSSDSAVPDGGTFFVDYRDASPEAPHAPAH